MKIEPTALVTVGAEDLKITLDEGGNLTAVVKTVRLFYGLDLYAAVKGDPKPNDKVQPYQPGYMKKIAAMGGTLMCPPTVKDLVTGEIRHNPEVICYPDTGIVRRVRATAICVVRNPMTGGWVSSMQTMVVDNEMDFRDAVLDLMSGTANKDAVFVLSDSELERKRQAGELEGFAQMPLGPPGFWLVYSFRNRSIIDAWKKLCKESKLSRQKCCSKAERLAADHNTVMRRVYRYASLTFPALDKDRNWVDPYLPYVDETVLCWVETAAKEKVDAMLEKLAHDHKAEGVESVVGSEVVDAEYESAPDEEERPLIEAPVDDPDPDPAEAIEKLAKREPEPAKSSAKSEPKRVKMAESGAVTRLRNSIATLEGIVGPGLTKEARLHVGIADPADQDEPMLLRAYRDSLKDQMEG